MRKNGVFSAKSFVTLFSVLSVLLIFSAGCFGVLLLLNHMNIVYFPTALTKNETAESGAEAAVSLPLYTERERTLTYSPIGAVAYESLAVHTPFVDSFYIKISVVNQTQDKPDSGIYEIWRFGEKYRINRYNEQDEVEYMVTCDGERVQIVDFDMLSASYYLMEDGYAFDEVAPLPSLTELLANEHELFEYEETDTLCIAVCDYPSLHMVDETQIFKSTGILSSYKRIQDGKTVLSLQTSSVDTQFVFSDRMFEID